MAHLMLGDTAFEEICDPGIQRPGLAGHDVHVIDHLSVNCVTSAKTFPREFLAVIPSGGPTGFVGPESRDLSSFARMNAR